MKTQPIGPDQASPVRELLSPNDALNRYSNLPYLIATKSQNTRAVTKVRYGFRLSNIGLLIAAQTHSEVMDPLPIFPLPNMPSWFLGLVNLRGNIVPVYDLEAAFNLHDDDPEKRYLIVLGKTERTVGLLIRGLPQPQTLEDELLLESQPPLPERLNEFASNAYMIDQRIWVEFNHERLFQSLVEEHNA